MWKVNVLSLFPKAFPGPLALSLAGKAMKSGIWTLNSIDIRDYAQDKHQTVDDKPFGGGNGMVMRPDILGAAIEDVTAKNPGTKLLYMSPRGMVFNQAKAVELSKENNITIICGRFEGIDERVIKKYQIEEISIGDFILSGGEIAAMAVIDACLRLLNGVIVKNSALLEESFGGGSFHSYLLEYPHYTRPANWEGMSVPDVLVSGNHAEVAKWRLQKAEELTKARRPDLWGKYKK